MEESGSIKKAGETGLNMLNEAKDQLERLFPGKEAVKLMIEVIDGFIEKML